MLICRGITLNSNQMHIERMLKHMLQGLHLFITSKWSGRDSHVGCVILLFVELLLFLEHPAVKVLEFFCQGIWCRSLSKAGYKARWCTWSTLEIASFLQFRKELIFEISANYKNAVGFRSSAAGNLFTHYLLAKSVVKLRIFPCEIPGYCRYLKQRGLKEKALLEVSEMSVTVAEKRQNPKLRTSKVKQA